MFFKTNKQQHFTQFPTDTDLHKTHSVLKVLEEGQRGNTLPTPDRPRFNLGFTYGPPRLPGQISEHIARSNPECQCGPIPPIPQPLIKCYKRRIGPVPEDPEDEQHRFSGSSASPGPTHATDTT